MSEVQQKDNFILYVVMAGVVAAGAMYMVKSSEHEKYASAEAAIAADSSNSAYRNDAIHSAGKQK
ncbi:MAG: hypothetical protein ACU836_11105 [Gammaproteobacteria bacterium]